jgi:hypothetical protein
LSKIKLPCLEDADRDMPVSGCQLEEQDCSYLLDLSYAAWGKAGQVTMLNLFEAKAKGLE